MPARFLPPPAAKRTVRKLGLDIKDARLRRGLPAGIIAERAGISKPTMVKVEKGDPGVSIGIYAAVLQALGLLDGLAGIADSQNDPTGSATSLERLPKRVHLSSSKKTGA
ncbi:helix-turn-helix transcriptional regulator [Ruegeria sp. HU-ET01832]|uniref:helix-turn-helix domain-containing protein n=1 Tax=Ruegeria sp. HU-ET01832 TaxID=3135906 RepID=UPI00310A198E